MRALWLVLMVACDPGPSASEPSDAEHEEPVETDVPPGRTDTAPPPGALEHVCSGDEHDYYWPVPPIAFDEAPRWGQWTLRSSGMWRYGLYDVDDDGLLQMPCSCIAGECALLRAYLVPLP